MPLTANEFESHGNTPHSRQCAEEVNSIQYIAEILYCCEEHCSSNRRYQGDRAREELLSVWAARFAAAAERVCPWRAKVKTVSAAKGAKFALRHAQDVYCLVKCRRGAPRQPGRRDASRHPQHSSTKDMLNKYFQNR